MEHGAGSMERLLAPMPLAPCPMPHAILTLNFKL